MSCWTTLGPFRYPLGPQNGPKQHQKWHRMAQNHQNGTTWHCFTQWSIWHDNEVQLRTVAGLEEQFNKLPDNGKTTTAITRQTESLVGPVLVRCEDDLDEKTVLAKVGPT